MEKNTLRKMRFLCFDLTPRWKMWKRIEDLEVRLATCLYERNEADGRLIEREHEVLALTQARDTLYKRIDELEGRLSKFDRPRGKNSKYIKGHETRSAK
nr:MAG TPA: SlyX [Caudoviricetes sp.]